MRSNKPRYLRFIDKALKIARILPKYSSKYSRKDFTQHQLMTLYILKQKSKLSYADFVEDFRVRDSAIEELGMDKVPSPSTLKMFIKRVSPQLLEKMIADCDRSDDNVDTAVDATGFSLEDGSYHYVRRIGLASKRRKNAKLSGCVDTDRHLFLSVKLRKNRRHDIVDYKTLIRKVYRNSDIEIRVCTADKAYDSEENHEFANEMGYKHIAPLKNDVPVRRTKGRFRKKLRREFPKETYNRRSIIESMFYCVKNLCGKVIKAKKWITQKKELLGKVLAYNIHRLVQLARV